MGDEMRVPVKNKITENIHRECDRTDNCSNVDSGSIEGSIARRPIGAVRE